MHRLLEEYLDQVATQLRTLPVKRRNEELREMRQHLLSTVEAHLELGATQQEAVEATLHQFGSSAEAASGLTRAWRRGQGAWLNVAKGGFLGAAALWGVFAACTLFGQYVAQRSNAVTTLIAPHLEPLFYILLFGLSALSGCLLRQRFARGTVKAMAWGTGLGYVGPFMVYEIVHAWTDSDIAPASLILLLQAACLTGAACAVGRRLRPARLARY